MDPQTPSDTICCTRTCGDADHTAVRVVCHANTQLAVHLGLEFRIRSAQHRGGLLERQHEFADLLLGHAFARHGGAELLLCVQALALHLGDPGRSEGDVDLVPVEQLTVLGQPAVAVGDLAPGGLCPGL